MALFIVASPIGNLSDISSRAIETLGRCALIAAEDTRRTKKLLAHLGMNVPLLSYYDPVESKRIGPLLEHLKQGQDVALISDAGTPCISDPGYHLVRAAIDEGIPVIPIPGACAVITALCASGLPSERFRFEGYLPRTDSQRREVLGRLLTEEVTTIYYETAPRLLATLEVLTEMVPKRPMVIAFEMTKVYENFERGLPAELLSRLKAKERLRGEITILIRGCPEPSQPGDQAIIHAIRELEKEGLPPASIRRLVASVLGVPKKRVFETMLSLKTY